MTYTIILSAGAVITTSVTFTVVKCSRVSVSSGSGGSNMFGMHATPVYIWLKGAGRNARPKTQASGKGVMGPGPGGDTQGMVAKGTLVERRQS